MISPRLLIYAALAIALLGVGLYVKKLHYQATVKLPAAIERAKTAEASAKALQAAHAHELKIANEASNAYQAELTRIRSAPSIGPVRLCRSPRSAVPATTSAASGSHAATAERVESAPEGDSGTDIGPALDSYGTDCEAVGAQLSALQRWVLAR